MHFTTYVVFGVFFLNIIRLYPEYYSNPAVSAYIRPTNDPILTFAPIIQIVRGSIIAFGIYPFRNKLIASKYGWAQLWWILVALQVLAAPNGVIENLIYTKIPLWFTLLNAPEIILQLLTFSVILFLWELHIESKI